MSLFPAYGDNGHSNKPNVVDAPAQELPAADTTNGNKGNWQSNHSYELPADAPMSSSIIGTVADSDSDSASDTDSESSMVNSSSPGILKAPVRRPLEFDNTVEYYVDKKPNTAHREMNTLPRLSRPRYRFYLKRLKDSKQMLRYQQTKKKQFRLFKKIRPDVDTKLLKEQSDEIMLSIGKSQTFCVKDPEQFNNYIQLHHLLSYNLTKSNRLAAAEYQLNMLQTSLQKLPGNEKLLQLYVAALSVKYPDSEVASKIERLLECHPFNYTLWTALIMTTQGTMARCNVPDVLNIYEQCMRRMNVGQNTDHEDTDTDTDTDDLMLKLFHNCVLFLRQSANCDRMFALLKLALELNTQQLNFDCFEARAEVERPLVEYEELVLQSGMPMPEIWTRIERLRQAFNFLPYPQLRGRIEEEEEDAAAANSGLDPQRFIYSEDVCRYIYPLKSKGNQLHLMLLCVQLTKLPFVRTNSLAERLSARIDQIGDSDAVEMLLASLGDRCTYLLPLNHCEHYTETILELAKELYVSPTFMPHFIGNELYEECISNLLLKCSEAFNKPSEETKRRVFIILWFRFERLRLLLQKRTKSASASKSGYEEAARLRQRKLLLLDQNRNVIRFYTELGMFDYEAVDDHKLCSLSVFEKITKMPADVDVEDVDLLHAKLIYAEILFARKDYEKAQQILKSCVLSTNQEVKLKSAIEESNRHLNEALKVANEVALRATQPMPLEDYFMPNKLMLLLRVHCLLLCLNNQSATALDLLNTQLNFDIFDKVDIELETKSKMETTRCRFMREQLCELQMLIIQLPLVSSSTSTSQLVRKQLVSMLEQSLLEFPKNLSFLQRWSTLNTLPWYKLRALLVHSRAGILALLHMIIAARSRFIHQINLNKLKDTVDELFKLDSHKAQLENMVRNRVLNLFSSFLPTNKYRSELEADQYAILRRNSLYWRCYLRCLSTESTSFERSKACLLMALDECPWDKALYMDGVTYVPQEVGNLQDVMTEKQLRIYAIPEELNVLREA